MGYPRSLLEDLYRMMVRIRLCEESFVSPILCKDIHCPCHLYSGQEAIAAGLCATLTDHDYVFGNHRSHGHYLAKGGGLKELVAEIYCRETGCSKGRGGSMHLIDKDKGMLGSAPIVAGTISLALGAAMASVIRKDGRVAVSFFGDGATGEGVLYESLNLAALRKLPIVFACENNLYATHMPIRECRVSHSIYKMTEPLGIYSREIDGNDVLAVYEAGKEAALRCRRGEGPVFLEFLTYRFRGHVGPDDNIQGCHTDIRPKEELDAWLKRDPIALFEAYLEVYGLMEKAWLAGIKREEEQEIIHAHEFAKKSPYPREKELENYVFA
ncbi:MAG: thiamine pyrophosphate-dependent dehydrogenase E1 component subunit alpha [Syntrophales bacterium]|nr:thiamine pyrophosphate-dependent dehydrogenase E1 component subunit alpha [Syntrophales bacterium]